MDVDQKKKAPYRSKWELTPSRPIRESRIAVTMASSLTTVATVADSSGNRVTDNDGASRLAMVGNFNNLI